MGVLRWLRIVVVAAVVALAVTAASHMDAQRVSVEPYDAPATSLSTATDERPAVLATTRSVDRPVFSDPRRAHGQDRGLLLALLLVVSGVTAASVCGRPRIRRGPRPMPAVSSTARLLRAPPFCLSF